MINLIFTTILWLLGIGLPIWLSTKDIKYSAKTLVLFPFIFITVYLAVPYTYNPDYNLLLPLLVTALIGLLALFSYTKKDSVKFRAFSIFPLILITLIIYMLSFKMLFWKELSETVNIYKYNKIELMTDKISPVAINHVRIVDLSQAKWKGNKIIGKAKNAIGSSFSFGDYSIQRVKDKLYWISPLEFSGFFKWNTFKTSPGYVMVDAEDPVAVPKLILNHKFKYMPSAYFSSNIERFLQSKYRDFKLSEFTFEVDDSGNPFWVITASQPNIAFDQLLVKGTVIVNPSTGESKFYNIKDTPPWVDRVISEELALDYINWHLRFKDNGFFNSISFGAQVDVEKTTLSNLRLVYGKDHQPYWFTGITSVSSKDESLTGYILMNSRTGETFRYNTTGSNEFAIKQVVNRLVSNYTDYSAANPILYNIDGDLSWVVPVVSGGILQRVAIVQASTSTGVESRTFEKAYIKYKMKVNQSRFSLNQKNSNSINIKATVVRVRFIDDTCYFMVKGHMDKVFTTEARGKLILTKPGDTLSFQTIDSDYEVANASKIKNLTLDRFNR